MATIKMDSSGYTVDTRTCTGDCTVTLVPGVVTQIIWTTSVGQTINFGGKSLYIFTKTKDSSSNIYVNVASSFRYGADGTYYLYAVRIS